MNFTTSVQNNSRSKHKNENYYTAVKKMRY
jgi:hypothetical protein